MKISKEDYIKVENKIKEVESLVDIEISVAVLDKSSDYLESAYLGALLFFFITSILLMLFRESVSLVWVLSSQACALLTGHLFGDFSFFKKIFIKENRKKESVYQKAREIYFDHGLASLSKKNGVLILVSKLEKTVEIISGELFENDSWKTEIDKITKSANEEDIIGGVISGLNDLGNRLVSKYPAAEGKENELSNQIIKN